MTQFDVKITDFRYVPVKRANAVDFIGDDSLGAGLHMAIYNLGGLSLWSSSPLPGQFTVDASVIYLMVECRHKGPRGTT